MVGKRTLNTRSRPTTADSYEPRYQNGDVETGLQRQRKFPRFRDAINTAIADKKRQEIKSQILDNVNPGGLDKYRKSDEEVS